MKGCFVVTPMKVPYGLGVSDSVISPGEGGRWLRGREAEAGTAVHRTSIWRGARALGFETGFAIY